LQAPAGALNPRRPFLLSLLQGRLFVRVNNFRLADDSGAIGAAWSKTKGSNPASVHITSILTATRRSPWARALYHAVRTQKPGPVQPFAVSG